ncbi:MAG TPA: DNA-binding response regulator, partial [Lachnospiraceae bacterium]|nr:DNA-binding response regulator [Lachnospiraceae bacterium]
MEQILIVEDDADNNTMLREYLENHGYRCTQAFSGSEAKLLFSMQKFDLVLLDL